MIVLIPSKSACLHAKASLTRSNSRSFSAFCMVLLILKWIKVGIGKKNKEMIKTDSVRKFRWHVQDRSRWV